MCGIVGAVGRIPDRLAQVRVLADTLVHRGPDEGGEYNDADCSLAMRRLSVIDVEGGHQPLFNESRQLVTVCNGELYNFSDIRARLESLGHQFSSRSDVEVLLHGYESWGVKCLEDINGMFAFALWDRDRRRLILGRDRVGKKPLYYTCDARGLAFASELRTLLRLSGRHWTIDREACKAFCLLGHMPGDRTPIAEIRRLPPGHTAVWDERGLTISAFWAPHPVPAPADRREALGSLRALFEDAVALRLISDVPLGAFLSGGLDSSLVVAMAAGVLGARIPTFSIAFPGHRDFDEATHARRVAREFGCEHHELPVTFETFQGAEEVIWALDEPLADPAALPTLILSRDARKMVTVVLTGEGADEVFGGYERYRLALQGSKAGSIPGLRAAAALALAARPSTKDDDSRASRILRAARDGGTRGVEWNRSLSLAPALAQELKWSLPQARPRDGFGDSNGHAHNHLLDLQTYDLSESLANGLLTKVDRMTMAASLEARCPFLDYRIVGFGLGLPDRWKMSGRRSKVLLRELAQQLLPKATWTRPKHTFRVPLAEWLRGPLQPLIARVTTSPVLGAFGIVPQQTVGRLADAHLRRRADYSRTLWSLITLTVWLERVTASVSVDVAA